MRNQEDKKMTLEVYENGLVVGFVQGKDIIDAYNTVRKHFPKCTSVDRTGLPLYDARCVKVTDNVYTWNLA
jgi:hypothetical protein